jgi:hypothetical protein
VVGGRTVLDPWAAGSADGRDEFSARLVVTPLGFDAAAVRVGESLWVAHLLNAGGGQVRVPLLFGA